MNQNYKSLMLGLIIVTAGQSLYSAAAGRDDAFEISHTNNQQAFFEAVRNNNIPKVEYLLNAGGIEINAWDTSRWHGATALGYVAAFGDIEMVKFLLAHGADVNRRDFYLSEGFFSASSKYSTPLQHAADRHRVEVMKLLLIAGADCKGIDFSNPEFVAIARVFSALKYNLRPDKDNYKYYETVGRLSQVGENILTYYKQLQAGRPDFLRMYIKEMVHDVDFIFSQNSIKIVPLAEIIFKKFPEVLFDQANQKIIISALRKVFSEVFEPESFAPLLHYVMTQRFADTAQQAEDWLLGDEFALKIKN